MDLSLEGDNSDAYGAGQSNAYVTDKKMTSHHSWTIVEMWADPSSNKLSL